MKKSEIKALKEAFNIPEPENKNDFIQLHEENFKKSKRRICPILILRYASAAAIAAVVICLCGLAGKNSDFNGKFNNASIITKETDSDSNSNTLFNTTTISTAATSTKHFFENSVTESTTVSLEATADTTALISQNIEIGNEPVYEIPENTSKTATNVVTTVSHESPTTDSASVTTATTVVTKSPTVTTSDEQDINKYPVTDGPDNINDFTVVPSVKYDKPSDLVYPIYDDFLPGPDGKDDNDVFDCVLIASVDEIIYTEINGEPYTQENITVIASLQGDIQLNYNDKISVFFKGGYMPADKFAENHSWINIPPEYQYVYYSIEQIPEQQAGKNYIFFLNKSTLISGENIFDVLSAK